MKKQYINIISYNELKWILKIPQIENENNYNEADLIILIIPDEIISMPIDKTKKPIIFDNDFNPVCPICFIIKGATENSI